MARMLKNSSASQNKWKFLLEAFNCDLIVVVVDAGAIGLKSSSRVEC